MIAELLQRRDLGADRHKIAEDFHLIGFAFDGEPTRSRSLEANKQDGVLRVWQPLSEMVQYAATRHHTAGGDDHAWVMNLVDLLRFIRRGGKHETRPGQRRAIRRLRLGLE